LSTDRPLLPLPDPDRLDPLVEEWKRGTPIIRCHNVQFGATEFNPGLGRGRFHPFSDPAGQTVATLYGASSIEGALSETVFHDVPVRGPARRIRASSLLPLVISTVVAKRTLRLVQLHANGLRRLQVSRAELIDGGSRKYAATALWARALHRCREDLDGLVWISRLHDTSRALVLFGDRVPRACLEVVESPLLLSSGRGLRKVRQVAEESDITIVILSGAGSE
jgi:hypothetical protein